MKSDTLIDPAPLKLKKCCGELPVVHQFTSIGCFGIECRINGHIHNTHLCNSLKDACREWNEQAAKREMSMIPWIYADLDMIIDSYSEPPKEGT